MKATIRTLDIFILMIALLYACSPSSGVDLTGTKWTLTELRIDGDAIELNAPINVTLDIDEKGAIGGSGGCNLYFGTADFKADGSLTIQDVGSTEMYCEQTMDVETAYLSALTKVESWSIDKNANTLTLTGAGGDSLLVFSKQP